MTNEDRIRAAVADAKAARTPVDRDKFEREVRVIKDDIDYRKTFDTKWGGETDDLGPSQITQPMLAAFTTSVVRAVVSEAVSRLPLAMWLAP